MPTSVDVAYELSGKGAPREKPANYPGWWPSESFILTDEREPSLLFLRPPTFGLEPLTRSNPFDFPFRLGHRELVNPLSNERRESLASYLRSRGLEGMDKRVPVLAVGSNAAPSQLIYKCRNAGASAAIPTMRVSLEDYAVGFVPSVSQYGYIPSTLIKARGVKTNLFLQFFDSNQLDVMDESEGLFKESVEGSASDGRKGTRYHRVWIDVPISIDGGETLGGAYAYVEESVLELGNSPVLSDNDWFGREFGGAKYEIHENPLAFPRVGSQDKLLKLLRSSDKELGRDFEDLLNRTDMADTEKAELLKRAHARLEKYAKPSEIVNLKEQTEPSAESSSDQSAPHLYGDMAQQPNVDLGTKADPMAMSGQVRVWPTLDNTEREGESVVVLNRDDFSALDSPSHVSVHSRSLEDVLVSRHPPALHAPRVVARCIPDPYGGTDGDSGSNAIPRGAARVDELLRVACGLHREELAEINVMPKKALLRLVRDGFVDAVLRKPNHVLCRVVLSDVTTMEREVALATPLTLQMLGIDSGDYIVMEGVSRREESSGSTSWSVSSTPARVFELDEQTLQRRVEKQNGGWLSAFPKAEIALGLAQDLPPVFIDSALRTRLFGDKHGQSVGTVRVRASRPDQIRRELREFAVIVFFSLIVAILSGETGAFSYEVWQIWAFVTVLLATVSLLIMRVRSRYRHTRRSRKWNSPVRSR